MSAIFTTQDELSASMAITPIYIVDQAVWGEFTNVLTPPQMTFAKAHKFTGKKGQMLRVPQLDGAIGLVLLGVDASQSDDEGPIQAGRLSAKLPEGYYRLERLPRSWEPQLVAIGWGMGAYKFENFLPRQTQFPVLVLDDDHNRAEIQSLTEAVHLCRDLINKPPNDMASL